MIKYIDSYSWTTHMSGILKKLKKIKKKLKKKKEKGRSDVLRMYF